MKQTFTIDDRSPLITYSPASAWTSKGSQDKTQKYYYANTMTISQTNESTVSFSFNGTAVIASGSKYSYNGLYYATLDGQDQKSYNGSANPSAFKVPLDSRTDLPYDVHTLILTNQVVDADHDTLTIDSFTLETEVDDSATHDVIMDDTNPSFLWYPASNSWQTDCTTTATLQNNTCHYTDIAQASVQLDFQGNALILYGDTGPTSGTYSVQIDTQSLQQLNAHNAIYSGQQVLFAAFGLSQSTHKLTITNTGTDLGSNRLVIDYVEVLAWKEDPWNVSDQSSGGGSGEGGNSPLSGGAIAGIVLGTTAVISLGILLSWLLRRRKRLFGSPQSLTTSRRYPLATGTSFLEARLANEIHPWQGSPETSYMGAAGPAYNPYAPNPPDTSNAKPGQASYYSSSGPDLGSSSGPQSSASSPLVPTSSRQVGKIIPIIRLDTQPDEPPPSYTQ